MASDLALPFEGLPTIWAILFYFAFLIILAILIWTTVLFVRAEQWLKQTSAEPRSLQRESDWMWVFLVPALNEEMTIRDSVDRLLQVNAQRKLIVVINDGSDDATGEVLDSFAASELRVITRTAPDARKGKAAALNHAYTQLGPILEERGIPRENVIATVVDADGRLDPHSPSQVARHFEDPRIGGVQVLVRIYNRQKLLTWMQDIEFGIFGFLFQSGRSFWGSAGMGGNGQFNRLLALDAVSDEFGPWRDKLTEDQDLGLRLLGEGWLCNQELRATVEQQGLSSLRLLYRQRTRWSQGNLQAMAHLPLARTAPIARAARVDLAANLLMPVWQSIIGASLVVAIVLAATGEANFWSDGPSIQLLFFYLLGFGGVMIGCIARGWGRHRLVGAIRGFFLANVYAFYSWLLWPVLVRATIRQLSQRRSWAKTQREAIT